MNLIRLTFMAIQPMLNPDGAPLDNGILDPAALLARRALNTVLDKDVSLSATVAVTIEGGEMADILPRKEEFQYARHGGWERFDLDAAKVSISIEREETATLNRLQLEKAVLIVSVGKKTSQSWWISPIENLC